MAQESKLVRVKEKWIAGVCGGIADFFGLKRDGFRLLWLILTIFTAGFPGVFCYFLLWFLMPKEGER